MGLSVWDLEVMGFGVRKRRRKGGTETGSSESTTNSHSTEAGSDAFASHSNRTRTCTERYSSQFKSNLLAEMLSGSNEASYLRLIIFVLLKSMFESNKEEQKAGSDAFASHSNRTRT